MAAVNYLISRILHNIFFYAQEKKKLIQVWNNSRVSTVLGELSLQSFLWCLRFFILYAYVSYNTHLSVEFICKQLQQV